MKFVNNNLDVMQRCMCLRFPTESFLFHLILQIVSSRIFVGVSFVGRGGEFYSEIGERRPKIAFAAGPLRKVSIFFYPKVTRLQVSRNVEYTYLSILNMS